MNRTDAIAWVLSVCAALRLSQAKTLADLVAAALGVGRVSLAALGRRMTRPTAAKHRIKRTWRFVANRRVEVSTAMAGVIRRLVRRRRKPLIVSLDWTEIRGFCTLVAAATLAGRAVPLIWASYPKGVLFRSQNSLEEGLLRLLRTLIPPKVPVILLADRGFGRAELARCCQQLGFHYVVRIRPDVWIEHDGFAGKLLDYPLPRGVCRMLHNVRYRKRRPVTQHVVVRWKAGLPQGRDEPWFLMTDLDRPAWRISELYARRMSIEELFRDAKSRRNGFALRAVRLKKADRIDRLLLIVTLAYILLVGLGRLARRKWPPSRWCSNNRPDECSDFAIGLALLDQARLQPAAALAAIRQATEEAGEKWG